METKPGYKTPAFWLGLVATIAAAVTAGGANLGSAAGAVALGVAALGTAGYAAWRTFVKSEDGAKPAWKTTEFWLSIGATVVSALYASGVFSDGGTADKIVGVVAMIFTALGYQVSKKK